MTNNHQSFPEPESIYIMSGVSKRKAANKIDISEEQKSDIKEAFNLFDLTYLFC